MAVLEFCLFGMEEAVQLRCEECWLDELGSEVLFVVLVGEEDEPG